MREYTKLMETVDACADRLNELNDRFPELSSIEMKESVDFWRRVRPKGSIEVVEPPKSDMMPVEIEVAEKPTQEENREKVRRIAMDLLRSNGLEDTLDILRSEYKVDLTIKNLIVLVGKKEYIDALRQDGQMLHDNAISFDQIADLWNDLERPAFGGEFWTSRTVSMLFE